MRLNAPWMLIGLVVALAPTTACMGGGDDEAATTSTPGETSAGEQQEPVVPPPSDLTAEPGSLRVVLTWAAPPESIESYALYRDGFALVSVDGSETTYVDEDVGPGESYTYEIESRLGDEASERVSVDTETTVPPVTAARLEGTFNVRTRVQSRAGYSEYQRSNFGWRFRPRCREGPCAVQWSDLHLKRLHATLSRRGGRYRGTYTGRFLIECGGSPSTSKVDLDLRVAAARPIGTEWRATRLVGKLNHSEAVQLGCAASSAELAVRARLVQ